MLQINKYLDMSDSNKDDYDNRCMPFLDRSRADLNKLMYPKRCVPASTLQWNVFYSGGIILKPYCACLFSKLLSELIFIKCIQHISDTARLYDIIELLTHVLRHRPSCFIFIFRFCVWHHSCCILKLINSVLPKSSPLDVEHLFLSCFQSHVCSCSNFIPLHFNQSLK